MKIVFLFILVLNSLSILQAHKDHYDEVQSRKWHVVTTNEYVEGSLCFVKDGNVYIETKADNLVSMRLESLSEEDKSFVNSKYSVIEKLNTNTLDTPHSNSVEISANTTIVKIGLSIVLIVLSCWFIYQYTPTLSRKYMIAGYIVVAAPLLWGFSIKMEERTEFITDPEVMDKTFQPFKPQVNTRWDSEYFYVESNGMPEHEMMTGITSWQQQVPIPQCYNGANAWSIPLKPELATVPVPVNQEHFLRGAVAVAANGIAIFNPYTNTGIDAFLDGQLDKWGGHCGRADDYHYHIAPLHLYNKTSATLPIAYALDGFAVYGNVEPDGVPMKKLDDNHGHFGTDGTYHYHGSEAAPYMIKNMVGKVTEDATLQIIPQAQAKGVRPYLQPLKGAVITGCEEKSTKDGYILRYTVNNQQYAVDYKWTSSGTFTFNFVAPNGTTTSTYNASKPCIVVNTLHDITEFNNAITVTGHDGGIKILLEKEKIQQSIEGVTISDIRGKRVFHTHRVENELIIKNIPKGMYIVSVECKGFRYSTKVYCP